MVNFVCQLDWAKDSQIDNKTLFGMCLRECFWNRLACNSVDQVKRSSLTDMNAAAKSLQSCPTLCDPIDGSPSGSAVPGTLQERTLEWVAISFSTAWKWKVKVKSRSPVGLFATPWTAAYQAPLSMGFSGQEYWSGVPLPSPTDMNRHHLIHWGPKQNKWWIYGKFFLSSWTGTIFFYSGT